MRCLPLQKQGAYQSDRGDNQKHSSRPFPTAKTTRKDGGNRLEKNVRRAPSSVGRPLCRLVRPPFLQESLARIATTTADKLGDGPRSDGSTRTNSASFGEIVCAGLARRRRANRVVRGSRHDGFRRVRAASVRLPASFSTRERDTPRAPPGYHRERALARPRALKERAKGKGAAVAGPEPAPVLQYFHFVIPMASGTEASATVAWSLRPGATDRLEKVVEL